MNVRRLCFLLGIAACWMLPTGQADAQMYGGYLGGPYYNGVPYSIYSQDPIPYFALHPPVYYSAPRSRPYGMSPFAYPPGSVLPPMAQPQMVINSYVAQNDSFPSQPPAAPPPMPKMIENPFVIGVKKPNEASLPQPQVESPKPAGR
jgi:hypothetical protein